MLHIDPDLASASTLPSSYYTTPESHDLDARKVLRRTWQLVAHLAQLPDPGSFVTTSVAGEPVVIVRGRDGVIRAMSNVCRHRAGPVATGCGKRPVLQCGYHGWTYGLDGRLLNTPEFEGVCGFDKAAVSLPHFRLEVWGQLIFVNLDPDAAPLDTYLGDIMQKLARRDFGRYRHALRKEWELDCNWKVYVDNYLEGYHIPIVHPSLYRELDYANYRTETRRYFSIQHSPIKRAERLKIEGDSTEAEYFWVFPNLMINVYPDNFSTNIIVPLGHERTLTIFEWYFEDEAKASRELERVVSFSDEIQIEDIAICEAVQRGLRSETYDRGRFSVQRENGVHHFHLLLAEFYGRE